MPDPLLGPVRTLRQHLIVAQTVNEICRNWAGVPKVAATSGGWLVSRPTGAIETVSTVETLWMSVLRGNPAAWSPDLRGFLAYQPARVAEDISGRVLALGQRLAHELATLTPAGPGTPASRLHDNGSAPSND
ncbi:hypothetical protein [Arthrobacter sp. UYEF3]|uniref:hypothetical protein n=1 Tax=Arthrobacter sp. UYEF3 TaxID=1756365 RepID=UPI003394B46E